MQSVPVSKASAIISKEWKKIKASEKEIINLHKKCNKKARKVSHPKKESASPKPNEAKKASASPKPEESKKVSGPIDDPSEEEKKAKKVSSNEKKTATRARKKAPKSPEFIDSSEGSEEEGLP